MSESTNVEQAVNDRYSGAAATRIQELCCPVEYESSYLEVIPPEILERDYGCGDPTRYLKSGEVLRRLR